MYYFNSANVHHVTEHLPWLPLTWCSTCYSSVASFSSPCWCCALYLLLVRQRGQGMDCSTSCYNCNKLIHKSIENRSAPKAAPQPLLLYFQCNTLLLLCWTVIITAFLKQVATAQHLFMLPVDSSLGLSLILIENSKC